jgi:Berberine and berberine like
MRALFELMNTLYTTAIEPSGGKFQCYMGVLKPPGVDAVCPIYLIYYNGPEEEGRTYAAPLFALEPMHGEPAMTNYAATTAIHKQMDAGNVHHRYTVSTVQLDLPLDVDILMTLAEDFSAFMAKYPEQAAQSKFLIELRSFAVTGAVPVSAMAYASRHKLVNAIMEAQYDKPELDGIMREEVQKVILKARNSAAEKRKLQGQREVLVNVNYSNGSEKLTAVFGENLPRLRELKRKYDPYFIFNKWYPIPPAEA